MLRWDLCLNHQFVGLWPHYRQLWTRCQVIYGVLKAHLWLVSRKGQGGCRIIRTRIGENRLKGKAVDTSQLGKRVRDLRREAGLSQEELASAAGMDRGHISNLENGRIENPGIATVEALARALRTTPQYLLGFEDHPGVIVEGLEDLPEPLREAFSLAVGLNRNRQEELRYIVRALIAAQDAEMARISTDIQRQASLLSAIEKIGGKDALERFFELVGFSVDGGPADLETLRLRFGVRSG